MSGSIFMWLAIGFLIGAYLGFALRGWMEKAPLVDATPDDAKHEQEINQAVAERQAEEKANAQWRDHERETERHYRPGYCKHGNSYLGRCLKCESEMWKVSCGGGR